MSLYIHSVAQMTMSLERCVEMEVLQSHYAHLHYAVVDPEFFGAHLVEYEFATLTEISGITCTLGYSNYQKTSRLLNLIGARFCSASRENAMNLFNKFVLIFAEHLKCLDIAEALITTYSKSD